MDAKAYATVLRLQSEHLQKLVLGLTAKIVAFEQAVADTDNFSNATTTIHMDEIGELRQNIEVEAERLQSYIQQIPCNWN